MEQVVSVTDDENGGSPNVFKIKTIMRVFEFQAKDEEERFVRPRLAWLVVISHPRDGTAVLTALARRNLWMQALREASGKTAQRMEADRKERQRAIVAGDQDSNAGTSGEDPSEAADDRAMLNDDDRRKQTTALPNDVADLLQKHKAAATAAAAASSDAGDSSSDEEEEDAEDTVKARAQEGIAKVQSMF